MIQAANTLSQSSVVELPRQLSEVKADLLRALMLADSAKTAAEVSVANQIFAKALAISHSLSFRASFHVVRREENNGRPTIEVAFVHDPTIWENR